MKVKIGIFFTAMTLATLLFVSCDKNNDNSPAAMSDEVTGTYKGSITASGDPRVSTDATVNVSRESENTIYVNMMSDMIDTTFMLNLYENGDSVMVCLTGDDFYNMYGHHLNENHHMMGNNGHMDWQHHMNEQHDPGAVHYGGFDMPHQMFSYRLVPDDSQMYYQFEGKKQ